MNNVLVVGAGGSIGSHLLNAAASDNGSAITLATHRHAVSATRANCHWLSLDYLQPKAIGEFGQAVRRHVPHLDRVVIATGLLHEPGIRPEKKMSDWSDQQFQQVMWVNAGAPLALVTELEGLLKLSTQPKVMILSAQIGSIGDNRSGGWYSYRMAKAALNMGVRTAAIESARWRHPATIVAVHPGTTRSGLSKPFTSRRTDLLNPKATAQALYQLLDNVTIEQSGSLLDRKGAPLPW